MVITEVRTRPAAAPDADVEAACVRCGGSRRLIVGDGPLVCRVCVMAWSALAEAIHGGDIVFESGRGEAAHASHTAPQLTCIWCRILPAQR
ncbi:MAG TPA: hypothetical protein VLR93_00970 [Patescibacteria group bacterium]|nr:hypothetical protein [Patescibacteria group bacterium]